MLRALELRPVYDSEKYDLIRDLQVPLLIESKDYLRGVGFFTSGWMRLAAFGLVALVEAGGKARFVVSPILEESDWEALQAGDAARTDRVLQDALSRNVRSLGQSLERDTRNALAWMVGQGLLEFRFALPRRFESRGIYHDKVGIFTDEEGERVAIHGSLNDSAAASLNGEAFSVFKSWEAGQADYVTSHHSRLESLWNDENRQFSVHRIPDAIRGQLVKLRTTTGAPYVLPKIPSSEHPGIRNPWALRKYQQTAITNWRDSGYRGVFDMATGTGKTITALACASAVYSERSRIALVVLVPYLHLLEQWAASCREFGFEPVECSGEHACWRVAAKSAVRDFNLGTRRHLCLLVSHRTAATDEFANLLRRLQPQYLMLVGDEVHALGAPRLRRAMIDRADSRLGLSATPMRWFDPEGTDAIFSYFGPVCFQFSLDEAIGEFLTPYEYYPELVSLTDEESDRYRDLTRRALLVRAAAENEASAREKLRLILIQRARIVAGAAAKLPAAVSLIQSLMFEQARAGGRLKGVLVYCAPGQHKEVLRAMAQTGLRCHEFVHNVALSDREMVLSQFASGQLDALVAIRCLDEGVDVPSTKRALILASSSNPREFVQRRGRILRKAPGKDRAIVHDFMVVPPVGGQAAERDSDVTILRKEMPRFVEFSSSATNMFMARQRVRHILDRFGMLHLLDEKPWDVYHSLKQWDWSEDE